MYDDVIHSVSGKGTPAKWWCVMSETSEHVFHICETDVILGVGVCGRQWRFYGQALVTRSRKQVWSQIFQKLCPLRCWTFYQDSIRQMKLQTPIKKNPHSCSQCQTYFFVFDMSPSLPCFILSSTKSMIFESRSNCYACLLPWTRGLSIRAGRDFACCDCFPAHTIMQFPPV